VWDPLIEEAMTSSRRVWLGVGLLAIFLLLAVVFYQLLPATVGVTDRLMTATSLPFPLFVGGLFLCSPAGALGQVSARRLFLGSAAPVLLGARRTARLFGAELTPVVEAVYFAMVLVLLSALVWSWWQERNSSTRSNIRAR